MARKSLIAREHKRERLVAKYRTKRMALKKAIVDVNSTREEREQAQIALQKLPVNSSPVRLRNRCAITGRPRGYFRKFGLCRNKIREMSMAGEIPGVVKASW